MTESESEPSTESPLGIDYPIDRRVLEELERRLERNANDQVSTRVSALRKTGSDALTADTTPQAVMLALQRLIERSTEDPRQTAGLRVEADASGSRTRYIAYYASPAELTDTPPPLERAIREAGLGDAGQEDESG
jgi:hypothetical protein